MKQYKCLICGYVVEAEQPPESCPLCGVGSEYMQPVEPAGPQKWHCIVCDHTFESEEKPAQCPVCGADAAYIELAAGDAPAAPVALAGETEPAGPDSGLRLWRCVVCGQEFRSADKPTICPVCGVGPEAIELVEEAGPGETADTQERFVLIGGGAAAAEAAKAIRSRNRTASITMVCGEELPPYNRPGLSDLIEENFPPERLLLASPADYEAADVQLITGQRAVRIDRYARMVYLAGGDFLPYDKLLLATGGRCFNPLQPQPDAIPIVTLRCYEDAARILSLCGPGKRAVLVGGGILGVEAAMAVAAQGVAVTVVERCDRLMPLQADPPASARIASALEKAGVAVLCGDSVAQVDATGVTLDSGTRLDCDFVSVSAGVRAETALAQDCGLAVSRGVIVDDDLRTSDPAIYAAGDCAEYRGKTGGLWAVATAQGKAAGVAMTGGRADYRPAPPATSLVIGDFQLFSVGTLEGDRTLHSASLDGPSVSLIFSNGRLTGAVLVGDVSKTARVMTGVDQGISVAKALPLLD